MSGRREKRFIRQARLALDGETVFTIGLDETTTVLLNITIKI